MTILNRLIGTSLVTALGLFSFSHQALSQTISGTENNTGSFSYAEDVPEVCFFIVGTGTQIQVGSNILNGTVGTEVGDGFAGSISVACNSETNKDITIQTEEVVGAGHDAAVLAAGAPPTITTTINGLGTFSNGTYTIDAAAISGVQDDLTIEFLADYGVILPAGQYTANVVLTINP